MGLPKFRRFYFPGLISLIFLPIIAGGYFLYNAASKKVYAIPVTTIDYSRFGERSPAYNALIYRKFEDQILTGDLSRDATIIAAFAQNVARFKSGTDTLHGYSLTFSDKVRYDEMIKVIDITQEPALGDIGFVLYKNKVLIWKATPTVYSKLPPIHFIPMAFTCGNSSMSYSLPLTLEQRLLFFKKKFSAFWPPAIALAAMAGFAFSKRKKYFDLKMLKFSGSTPTVKL